MYKNNLFREREKKNTINFLNSRTVTRKVVSGLLETVKTSCYIIPSLSVFGVFLFASEAGESGNRFRFLTGVTNNFSMVGWFLSNVGLLVLPPPPPPPALADFSLPESSVVGVLTVVSKILQTNEASC